MNSDFLNTVFLNNQVKNYLIALMAFIVLSGLFKLFQTLILRRLKKLAEKTKTEVDDIIVSIVERIKPPFYFYLSFYLALFFLNLGSIVQNIINTLLIVVIVYQVVIAVQILINFIARKTIQKEGTKESSGAVNTISLLAKIIIWSFGLLLVLSNLGINVTSLIAGLGIGGIAVALAMQNILGDLFSSFAIHFDKPFVIGDFIVVGDQMGVVEKIGIKTTRIKSLQGEEIIISNNKLTSSNIRNFKKMKERRVVFNFGVLYGTEKEKLKKIPEIIKGIIKTADLTRLDRVHFKSFDDSALTFEVVYFVLSNDYKEYMDINQTINYQIKEIFEKEKISMAYPTQTIYLKK